MPFNALQTHALLVAHAPKESALEMETQQMMTLEPLQPLQTVVTAADLVVAMSVHSEVVATDKAQPEEAAWEVVPEATAVVEAADVAVVVATVVVAAAADQAEVVVAAATDQAVVVAESPRMSILADDHLDQSRRAIDYLNSHCLLFTT